jgi:hypothetical protein
VRVRRRVNDLVTEDLLGPEWRRRPVEDRFGLEQALTELFETPLEGEIAAQLEDPSATDAFCQVEEHLEIEAMISRASLGPREAEIIAGLQSGERLTEIANRLRIKPGAATVAASRAKRKLQKAAQGPSSGRM